MTVLRILPNLAARAPQDLAAFHEAVLGLSQVMDAGFIVTTTALGEGPLQLSLASEGGSGTKLPSVSIEVDDLDATLTRAKAAGAVIPYGPVTVPWGVRRFYLRDPENNLINIVSHIEEPT